MTSYEMRISDWSSDVCSSDLEEPEDAGDEIEEPGGVGVQEVDEVADPADQRNLVLFQKIHGQSYPIVSCRRSEEHTYELQSLMRISYAVFCLKKNKCNRRLQIARHQTTNNSNNK